jgi:Mg-chelatase subunit ChlD
MPVIRSLFWAARISLGVLVAGCCWAQTPQQKLEFAKQLQLLDCQPANAIPCFRASLNVLDAQGVPTAIDIADKSRLATDLKITADGLPVKVFYTNAGSDANHQRSRYMLILLDISGSMAHKMSTGETRFDQARSVLAKVLAVLYQEPDLHVAVVPFESHQVKEIIHGAVFADTLDAANTQVDRLSFPKRTNNTALYSAVEIGLEVLKKQLNQQPSSEGMLVVMTDGKNEVFPGDDIDLLKDSDLEKVRREIKSSQLPVAGIGFGGETDVDRNALEALSTIPPVISPDVEKVKNALSFAGKLLVNRIEVSFLSPKPDLASLAGQTINFQATLKLPDGNILSSNRVVFETPQLGTPLMNGKADEQEIRALYNFDRTAGGLGWLTLLRPVFVFLALGGLLLLAWFGIPRLIWPGQYIGNIGTAKPAVKWAGPLPASKKPPGFDTSKTGSPDRKPQDATVVRPVSDVTKTRLQRDYKN